MKENPLTYAIRVALYAPPEAALAVALREEAINQARDLVAGIIEEKES